MALSRCEQNAVKGATDSSVKLISEEWTTVERMLSTYEEYSGRSRGHFSISAVRI